MFSRRTKTKSAKPAGLTVDFQIVNPDAKGVPILFSAGFLTEGSDRWIDWIQRTFPDHPIYHILWASQNTDGIVTHLKELFTRQAQRQLGLSGWIRRSVGRHPYTRAAFAALDLALMINDARHFWLQAMSESERVGAYSGNRLAREQRLAEELQTLDRFVVIGHSLGARLLINLLDRLRKRDCLEQGIFLGSAVNRSDKLWRRLKKYPVPIHNVYSTRDQTLKYLYRFGNLSGKTAAGRAQVKLAHVHNHDVSALVSGHTGYLNNPALSAWLRQLMRDPLSPAEPGEMIASPGSEPDPLSGELAEDQPGPRRGPDAGSFFR